MSRPLGTTGLASFNQKFQGIYRGTVIDSNDPDKLGRVRVKVYPMFSGIADNILPWAIICQPMFEGAGNGCGCFCVPDIGSNVYIMFEEGSPYQPIVIGEAPDRVKGLPLERLENYPDRKVIKSSGGVVAYIDDSTKTIDVSTPYGLNAKIDDKSKSIDFKTPSNNEVKIDDTSNSISILHSSGALIVIDMVGQVNISCANINVTTWIPSGDSTGDAAIEVSGNISLNVLGTTDLTSSGAVNISGSSVNINT